MRYRSVLVASILSGILLTGVLAATGCQSARTPAPTETARPPVTAPENIEPIFSRELLVKEDAGSETEIQPGLYLLTATDGEGFFRLVIPGQEESLIRELEFKEKAWVEVKAGELLKIRDAGLETFEERELMGRSTSRLNNGFFLVGMDIYPGTLAVQSLGRGGEDGPVCAVFDSAHDLSQGPVRSYDFDFSLIYIEVEEGEFLYLRNAEAYVPPT